MKLHNMIFLNNYLKLIFYFISYYIKMKFSFELSRYCQKKTALKNMYLLRRYLQGFTGFKGHTVYLDYKCVLKQYL